MYKKKEGKGCGYYLNMELINSLSNAELEKATGMARSNISTMRARGRVNFKTAERLAKGLDLPMDKILVVKEESEK